MEENKEKKTSSWGGAREGSGRKKKYVKSIFFSATEEVVAILDSMPSKERTEFINKCIMDAVK